jgi:adenine-specific DNA-methyltransferase
MSFDTESDIFNVSKDKLFNGKNYLINTTIGYFDDNKILEKIEKESEILTKYCDINAGIQTGADRITKNHTNKFDLEVSSGGIYILSDEELNKLSVNKGELSKIKPWYSNSDIRTWSPSLCSNFKLIYLDKNDNELDNPNLINHLIKYKDILLERREMKNGSKRWFELWWPRDISIFSSPKIICCKWSNINSFSYTDQPWFASVNVTFINSKSNNTEDLKYFLSLLNSKLFYYYLYNKGKRSGNRLMLDPNPVKNIPIKKIPPDKQRLFINFVDQILEITSASDYDPKNPPVKQKELEKQIDELVYKIYDLTLEEIEIVENSTKK